MKGKKHIIFDNQKFTLDEKTGYYLKSTKPRKRLHIYIWEYYNGPVPKGHQIHHKDFNKNNNDISNLECIPRAKHIKIHSDIHTWSKERLEKARKNIEENARPAATKWHKSEKGREWHKEHYKESLGKTQSKKVKKKCIICGKEYEVSVNRAYNSKFCSNNCKTRYRRLLGVDNVEKVCIGCGKTYKVNKYYAKDQLYCSRKCADKYGRRPSSL